MEREEIKELFPKLQTRRDVAKILEIKESSLRYFLFKRRPENMYSTFSIKKRNGSDRQISAPQKELKAIQRKLAHVLTCVYEPKICAYGFIRDASMSHGEVNFNIVGRRNFEQKTYAENEEFSIDFGEW